MDVAKIVDDAIGRTAIVFGSVPPEGRDLDLLARPPEVPAIESALRSAGFDNAGSAWVRFSGGRTDAVDVIPAAEWRLPASEVEALFDESVALEGLSRLARPSPHHELLIMARRAIRDGALLDKRRARLQRAVTEDSDAWDKARARAKAWGGVRALDALRGAYESDAEMTVAVRATALREELAAQGIPAPRSVAGAWKRVTRPPSRGHVVTFSGLDGSGKSTQATALHATLERLGYEAVIEWTKIARSSWLEMLSKPVRKVMKLRRDTPPPSERTVMTGDGPVILEPEQAAAKELRRKSKLLTHAWTSLVAISNGWDHRRATARHLRAGRVVICDRYTLDTSAHLRYRYGVEKRFGFQSFLNRAISPSPLLSFFLDVSPEAAYARKTEQYEVADLELLRRLYLKEAARARVSVIPGEDEPDAVSERIARDVWTTLAT